MYCANCGNRIADDATFCGNCGADLRRQTPPPKKLQDSLDSVGTTFQSDTEVDSFRVGSVFAERYEILSEGLKGGMGVVYKCRDTMLNNKVKALKIIHPRLVTSKQATTRFRQEVAISQELNHENVVRVYDIEEWEGNEYFTMEWVEGLSLREIITQRKKEKRPFSVKEAYKVISQLGSALDHAHKYTIHRDIKPENILIKDDRELKIKLSDFGIAKMLNPSLFASTSMQMGTPYYMAPEQKVDAAHVDKRADIYALGVVLYELLTLENTIGLELPSEMNKELSPVIDTIIKKAIATKPEDRYGTASELSEALNKVVDIKKHWDERERKQAEELMRQNADERKRRLEEEKVQREKDEAERRTREETSEIAEKGYLDEKVDEIHDPQEGSAVFATTRVDVTPKQETARTKSALFKVAAATLVVGLVIYFAYEKLINPNTFLGKIDRAISEGRLYAPAGNCVADFYRAKKAESPDSKDLRDAVLMIRQKLEPVGDAAIQRLSSDSIDSDWENAVNIYRLLNEIIPDDKDISAKAEFCQAHQIIKGRGRKNYVDALARYQRALELKPNWILAMNGIAKVYVRKDSPYYNKEEALNWYNKVSEVDQNFPWAYTNIAAIYAEDKQWYMAEQALLKALRIRNTSPSILAELGKACEKQNRPSEAKNYYQEALKYEKDATKNAWLQKKISTVQ